ncbi:MAG: phosphate-starvation-inducible PsiE family protein [Herbinix sp.]|nr:phosphate-starvation-inducible PsiE family protein [Herbinix sp.]
MKRILNRIFQLTRLLELIISIAILIAIGISMITLVSGLRDLLSHSLEENAFQNFLAIAFNILIGIEFLKMIYKYSVDTVIEVLLFAIARQLIVGHTTVVENFVGIASIAVLFIIRKYMFVPELDIDKKEGIKR